MNKKSNISPIKILSKTFGFIKKHRMLAGACLLFSFFSILLNIAFARIINGSIDSAIAFNKPGLMNYIIGMIFVVIFGIIVTYFSKYLLGLFKSKIILDIRNHAVEHLRKLSPGFIENHHSGDLISRFTNDLSATQNFIGEELFNTAIQMVTFIIVSIYLVNLNWKLYIASLIILPPVLYIVTLVSKPMAGFFRDASKNLGAANSTASDSYGGIFIIKAFNLEQYFQNKFSGFIDTGLKFSTKGIHRVKYMPIFDTILHAVPGMVCLIYGTYLAINGAMTPGQVFSYLYLLVEMARPLAFLPNIISNLARAIGASQRFFEIMDTPGETETGTVYEDLNSPKCVVFKDVSFSYDNKKQEILKKLSLEILRGSKTALVGLSGCGKSTVLKLMSAFYDNHSGVIELFGYNMRDWDIQALRSNISYVSQDTFLFPATVMENISYGKHNATEQEIINAAMIANAHEFIMGLPQGYDTPVGERGIKLSGGERQRISIARAVLKDAPIILLDEPTSALDTISEALVQDALDKVVEGKTAIIVAHRLSTIKDVDEILVLDDGFITERGTHKELIASDNLYSQLYKRQLGNDSEISSQKEGIIC